MSSKGRGRSPRGGGSKAPWSSVKLSEFPALGSASVPSAKDILLTPEIYTRNTITEETLLYIEPADEKWMKDPWEIKNRYLSTQQNPTHFELYRYIYENIILETATMEIKHTFHDSTRTNSPIAYSKVTIKQIMPISQWGLHPHTTRSLDIRNKDIKYSYWDYIDSFSRIFQYQNPIHNHSWFIRICPDVLSKNDVPNWFLVWWDQHGITHDTFPTELQTAFSTWSNAYQLLPVNHNISVSKMLIHFIIRFNIPWIWKWDLECDYINKIPRLKRVFYTKWWDKGMSPMIPDLLKSINHHTQVCISARPKLLPEPVHTTNPFTSIQQKLKQQHPEITDQELLIKTMDFMKEQFIQSLDQNFEDSSMKSSTSIEDLQDENTFHLLEENHDPDDDTTIGNFWDSLTVLISDKIEKNKTEKEKSNKGKGKADT